MMTETQKARLAEYNAAKAQCPARTRLAALFDDGIYTELGSGINAGVVTAYGYIGGCPAYAFSQDKTVDSGAVSKAHSAKICKLFDLAAKNGVAVVGIYDSCGAFIEDGADALNAYSEILLNVGNLSGVVPMISVISGVCAGSMAMIAASADFTVITEGAELYITAGEASSADNASENGIAAAKAENDEAAFETVKKYISMMPANNLSPIPEFEYSDPAQCSFDNAENACLSIADEGSVLELYADFGGAAYTSLCTVAGASVGFAAVNKTADKLTADDCAKLTRFVRLCDAYSVPIITLVDTEGFALDKSAVRSWTALSGAYAEATCAKIALVSGKACGPAFIALAGKNVSADAVFALPQAVIAPIDPAAAVEFLYHDKLKGTSDLAAERSRLAEEYAQKEASAFDAAQKGAVDDVIAEADVRTRMISMLDITAGKRLNKRLPKKHSILPL